MSFGKYLKGFYITEQFVEVFSNFFITWNDNLIFNKCDSFFRFDFIEKKGATFFQNFRYL